MDILTFVTQMAAPAVALVAVVTSHLRGKDALAAKDAQLEAMKTQIDAQLKSKDSQLETVAKELEYFKNLSPGNVAKHIADLKTFHEQMVEGLEARLYGAEAKAEEVEGTSAAEHERRKQLEHEIRDLRSALATAKQNIKTSKTLQLGVAKLGNEPGVGSLEWSKILDQPTDYSKLLVSGGLVTSPAGTNFNPSPLSLGKPAAPLFGGLAGSPGAPLVSGGAVPQPALFSVSGAPASSPPGKATTRVGDLGGLPGEPGVAASTRPQAAAPKRTPHEEAPKKRAGSAGQSRRASRKKSSQRPNPPL